jgi:hypothetical protein
MEQLYLEQMIVKPMPKKQVIINVKMGDAKKKEEPEKNPRKNVEIVDKRDEMNININTNLPVNFFYFNCEMLTACIFIEFIVPGY